MLFRASDRTRPSVARVFLTRVYRQKWFPIVFSTQKNGLRFKFPKSFLQLIISEALNINFPLDFSYLIFRFADHFRAR